MKAHKLARSVLNGVVTLALVSSAVTVAFHLTSYWYVREGRYPSPLIGQLINTALGLTLMVVAIVAVGLMSRSRRRGPFAPIIQALERISKGDFSTRLDDRNGVHGAVGELAKTVNDMALKLDQMEKMRQEFISDVSHEIQSPLTSIRGFAIALQEEQLSAADRRHYLEIIEAESLRLSKLSANLLKLASLESDQVKFEPKPYRLDSQIRSLILACEMQWSGKHLEMDVALEEATITADEDLLSQVWINLIHNSIKFTPEGGAVRVALRRSEDRLVVTIADTGTGIPQADLPHVFERFYKADKSRRRSEGGSGLGLAIAKKVVEMHRGTIAAESRPGSGALFTVELPER